MQAVAILETMPIYPRGELKETTNPYQFHLIVTIEIAFEPGSQDEIHAILEYRPPRDSQPYEIWIWYEHTIHMHRDRSKRWVPNGPPCVYRLSRDVRDYLYLAGRDAFWHRFFGTGMDALRSIGYWSEEQ
jgi:hypothetical protein